MPKSLVLMLTHEQRAELEEARDTHLRPYMRERCAALLKVADGASGRAVALDRLLRPHWPDTVYEWVRRYREEGLQGLRTRPGRGRKPASSPEHGEEAKARDALLHDVRQDPRRFGENRNRWTLKAILRVCVKWRVRSVPGMSRLLRRLGISYKRGRCRVHSPAPGLRGQAP